MELPKLKKKVKSFLAREEGRISKDRLIKVGVLAGIAASAIAAPSAATYSIHSSAGSTAHTNNMAITVGGPGKQIWGSHRHHPTKHSSHTSY